MTEALNSRPMRPRLPAPHFGGATPFEQRASRAWGLSLLDARALLVMVKGNGTITCANLGAALWGRAGRANCSCPWARPAGVVMKRLRLVGLVERDYRESALTLYRVSKRVEALIRTIKEGR